MTGGGIEPTTIGLKVPYRIPFDYPAILKRLRWDLNPRYLDRQSSELNHYSTQPYIAALYFTKQLPHRVLHQHNHHWVYNRLDLSQLLDWVPSSPFYRREPLVAAYSILLQLHISFHDSQFIQSEFLLASWYCCITNYLGDLLLQANALCEFGTNFHSFILLLGYGVSVL